jgi:hypothetical protein
VNTVVLLTIAAGTLLVALALGRYHHRSRLEQWRQLLEPAGDDVVQALTESCALDSAMAEDAYVGALRARTKADITQAVRLLELACRVIEEATPSRLHRLRVMSRLIRMTMAILPVEAVPTSAFQLRPMVAVAGVGEILHMLLVAPAERFALRLRILAVGFKMTVRVLRRSTNVAAGSPQTQAAWDTCRRALTDWSTLDQEHLRSVKALTAALAVELERDALTPPAA